MRMFGFSTRAAVVAAGLMACGLVAGSAAPAMADAAPAPQICASGAMTITRDGPTVYDGVDCTPAAAPKQAAASAPPAAQAAPPAAPAAEPVVAATPSNTELRPVEPAAAVDIVPVTPVAVTPVETTSSHSSPLTSEAEAAAAVLAMLGAAVALLPIARRRRMTAVAEGLD
jgi:hypothetical protein